MANINLSKAYKTACFDGFGGIDRTRTGTGGIGVADLKNLRVCADKSLQKRNGFAPLITMPEGNLRAIHAVSESLVFALVDNYLYEINLTTSACTLKKTLAESNTDACFFYYDNILHLLDGKELYSYVDGVFDQAQGYIPLYGKEWDPDTKGPVNEPENAMSYHMRVSYKVGNSSPDRLILPCGAETVDKVYVDGRLAPSTDFPLNEAIDSYITVKDTYPKDTVIEVFFTPYPLHFLGARQIVAACTRAATFGTGTSAGNMSSLALYGKNNTSQVFVSRQVSAENLAMSQTGDYRSTSLYINVHDSVYVDTEGSAVTATCRMGARLAIFTKNSAQTMSEENDILPDLAAISQTLGCSVKDGAISFDNAPVTLSDNGIFVWTPSTVYDNEYNADCISYPVGNLFVNSDSGCAVYHKRKNELWFYTAGSSRILIYNTLLKCWYSFSGFAPECMLEIGGDMAFIENGVLYKFSDELTADSRGTDQSPIEAVFESTLLDFDTINRRKRLARIMLSCSAGAQISLKFKDAEGNETEMVLTDSQGERLGYCESRISCKRSRYYSFSLSNAQGAFSLHRAILSAVE